MKGHVDDDDDEVTSVSIPQVTISQSVIQRSNSNGDQDKTLRR